MPKPSEVGKIERLKFIAKKTEDGTIKVKISFYCKALKVSRQAFYNYLRNKNKPWKYGHLSQLIRNMIAEDECNDTHGRGVPPAVKRRRYYAHCILPRNNYSGAPVSSPISTLLRSVDIGEEDKNSNFLKKLHQVILTKSYCVHRKHGDGIFVCCFAADFRICF